MSKKFTHIFWRSCLLFVEGVAILAVVVAIALGILVGAMKAGPVSINFAKGYIQASLYNEERGVYGEFDNAVLSWPKFDGPFMLGLDNGRVLRVVPGAEDVKIISVAHADLGLSKSGLLVGRVQPVSLIVSTLQLDVVRDEKGDLDFGLGDISLSSDEEKVAAQGEQTAFLTQILNYIGTDDESAESSPLSQLKLLHIKDAQIHFSDQASGLAMDFVESDVKFESEAAGLKARLDLLLLNDNEGAPQKGRLIAEAHVSRQLKKMAVVAKTAGFDLGVLLPYLADNPELTAILKQQDVVLDAKVATVLGKNLVPEAIEYSVASRAGALQFEYMSDKPIAYKDFQFAGTYDHAKGKFKLSRGEVNAGDVTFSLSAQIDRQKDGGYLGPVKLKIAELPQDKIGGLWPQGLDEETAREWLVDKMSNGVFRDVVASMILGVKQGEKALEVTAQDIKASLVIDGIDVDYRSPLPAVIGGMGKAEFLYDAEKLLVHVDGGTIGGMKVEDAKLEFNTILQTGKGTMDVDVDLSGSLQNMFGYIVKEPIGVEHKFDASKIKGEGKLAVHVSMPTTKDVLMSQVKIKVEGTVDDVFLPNVVEGLPLSGGPFKISVNNERARVVGKGMLSGRPVDVTWMEYLRSKGRKYKGKITAKITADEKLRDHFGIDLSDFMRGDAKIALTYLEYAGGKSVADVLVDMSPAEFFVEPFGYMKPRRQKGSASFKAVLQNGDLQEINNLLVKAKDFSLADARIVFKGAGKKTKLSKGRLGKVRVEETNAAIDFEVADNGATKIWLKGPFLDLRPFLKSDEKKKAAPYSNPPMVLSVEADTMRTADEEVIMHGKIFADINAAGKFNQLEFDAVAGAGDIYLRYKPDSSGARTFRFEADDAGATLQAFEVYKNIRGGKMLIYGEPIHGIYDRNLIGLAEITDFRVVHAPGLAKLLGAMSLPGVTQLLGNEGIVFSKLESNFDWVNRPRGSILVLKNGRTSGNSLGLTFDGVFDKQANKVDVSGTIIPLSTLNKMLGGIPILGDILGGAGGLFAATYTIKGKGDDPEIKVNPLSVLAPGIFRRILFE